MNDDMIDIDQLLLALDNDLNRKLSLAQRLEPILRDIVRHYGVPAQNWHSFGVVFRINAIEEGKTGLEIGGMALRASNRPRQEEPVVNQP